MSKPISMLIPLFPLKGVVLFPGALMPLRVFEPRYIKLLEDALSGENLIGMANIRPDASAGMLVPPLFDVLGVGRVVKHKDAGDGTYHIMLLGENRCRILEEVPHDPYRVARVITIPDKNVEPHVEVPGFEELHRDMMAAADRLVEHALENDARSELQKALRQAEAGTASDLLASIFVQDIGLRQALLETPDVIVRTQVLRALFDNILSRLERPDLSQQKYDHKNVNLN